MLTSLARAFINFIYYAYNQEHIQNFIRKMPREEIASETYA